MMTLLLLYNFYCGFSGQTFFDSWLIGLVNVFFSFVQPLLLGVFDSDVSDEMVETNPKLYLPLGREWMFFNWKVITKEVILSIVEGAGLFFTIYILMLSMNLFSVYSGGLIDYGTVAFFCFIILIDLRVMAYAETFNRIIFLGLLFTWLMVPLFLFLYSALPDLLGVNYMVNVIPQLFRTSMFYQYIYLTVVIYFFILHLLINELIETFIPFRNSRAAMQTAYEIDNATEFYSSAPASPEDSPIALKTA